MYLARVYVTLFAPVEYTICIRTYRHMYKQIAYNYIRRYYIPYILVSHDDNVVAINVSHFRGQHSHLRHPNTSCEGIWNPKTYQKHRKSCNAEGSFPKFHRVTSIFHLSVINQSSCIRSFGFHQQRSSCCVQMWRCTIPRCLHAVRQKYSQLTVTSVNRQWCSTI